MAEESKAGGGESRAEAPSLFSEQEIYDVITGKKSENPFTSPAVVAADWLGFIILGGSSVALCLILMNFKGPRNKDVYFMGYREEKMLCVYINSFSAFVYWARCCSHANGDVGAVAYIHLLKYIDYLFTCPLLTSDLLCSLNLPYKVSYAYFVWLCIACAVGASKFVQYAKFMWFGLGVCLFALAWFSVYRVVYMRLRQLENSKISSTAKFTIQVAAVLYFSIWLGFPILWLLLEFKIIGHGIQLCMHAVLDVVCKSLYGFILLSFQLTCEKEEYIFLPLQPTIPEDDNASETDNQGDVELGYTFSDGTFKANHLPKGPVIGSSQQRRISREILASMDPEGRPSGSNLHHRPRSYNVGSAYMNSLNGNGSGYDGETPARGYNEYVPNLVAPSADEAAVLKQIQALNSQLNDMVDGSGRR